jgi:hypothetical protein
MTKIFLLITCALYSQTNICPHLIFLRFSTHLLLRSPFFSETQAIYCTNTYERKYANYIMGWQVVDGIS